ncbi:hypothetical protein BV25DRAFT_1139593 [Artomyces pyxidatus]|uniref:Uncharacterized protein n=1 Tax=Artomyces pyxidatus TaxID=48021 RepID=A0ACB8SRT1_9AGAM|nr:hypothetical protein BV25DRAFT_1139593 [Artomyces pyxidatus]
MGPSLHAPPLKAPREYDYVDPAADMWTLYLTEAEKNDIAVTEDMKANTDGILVFTGLFSATVAAFVIESYKDLQPDSGDIAVALLTRISMQLAAASNTSQSNIPSTIFDATTFRRPPSSALRVNILWFLSLVLSLSCALVATLMQQWTRNYLQDAHRAHRAGTPQKVRRIHMDLFKGLRKFRMTAAVAALLALLHTSVFLFFDTTAAYVILSFMGFGGLVYGALTGLPFVHLNFPYATPLSTTCRQSYMKILSYVSGSTHKKSRVLQLEEAATRDGALFQEGLRWTLTVTMDDDNNFQKFLEFVPGVMSSPMGHPLTLHSLLTVPGLGTHFRQLLNTTAISLSPETGLSGLARTQRAMPCLKTLLELLFARGLRQVLLWRRLFTYVAGPLAELRTDQEPDIAIRASCAAQIPLPFHLGRAWPWVEHHNAEVTRAMGDLADCIHPLACLMNSNPARGLSGFSHELNVQVFVDAILPHLASGSDASLGLVWSTLHTLLATTDRELMNQERTSILLKVKKAAEKRGVDEVDGPLTTPDKPLSPNVLSNERPYARLYILLGPPPPPISRYRRRSLAEGAGVYVRTPPVPLHPVHLGEPFPSGIC